MEEHRSQAAELQGQVATIQEQLSRGRDRQALAAAQASEHHIASRREEALAAKRRQQQLQDSLDEALRRVDCANVKAQDAETRAARADRTRTGDASSETSYDLRKG